jgi:hypothetical protein
MPASRFLLDLEGQVRAYPELPRVQPHGAAGEQEGAALEGYRVEVLADGEELRGSPVQLRPVDGERGDPEAPRLASSWSTRYTLAWRVSGEWSELCLGSILKRLSMPSRSWSSQAISFLISGLYAVMV